MTDLQKRHLTSPSSDIDLSFDGLDFDADTYRCFETAISNLNIELQKG